MSNVTTANIFIEGAIWPESYIWEGEVATSLHRVRQQVQAAGDFDAIKLNIFCCPGGYCLEGWAIVDYLMSLGKPIETVAIGQCASFGTILATMGSVRQISPNCEYLVHRPWGVAVGNDIEIAEYNALLMVETGKMFTHYSKPTTLSIPTLQAFIGKTDVILSAEECVSKGFATSILQTTQASASGKRELPRQAPIWAMSLKDRNINPNAGANPNPKNTLMSKVQSLGELFASLQANVTKLFAGEAVAEPSALVALDVNTESGQVLKIDASGENDTPVVGDPATIDGEPAPDNDYTASGEDKTVYTVADGKLSAITKPETTDDTQDNAAALATANARITELEGELASAKTQLTTLQTELSDAKTKHDTAMEGVNAQIAAFAKALGERQSQDVEVVADNQAAGGDGVSDAVQRARDKAAKKAAAQAALEKGNKK